MEETSLRKLFLVNLEHFKGSLFELVHLCKAAEISPLFVHLQEIAKQMDPEKILDDFSLGPDFIELYTHLIYLKSKYLLPLQEEEEEESVSSNLPLELLEKIEAYFQIKATLSFLEERQASAARSFPRAFETQQNPTPSKSIPSDSNLLRSLLQDVLKRTKMSDKKIHKDTFSIEEEISKVASFCRDTPLVKASQLFSSCSTTLHVIVIFLAILELIKEGKGSLKENEGGVYFTYKE